MMSSIARCSAAVERSEVMTGTEPEIGVQADGRRKRLPAEIVTNRLGAGSISTRLERSGQILWILLAALMLAYFLATIPGIVRVSERVCRAATPSSCESSQLTIAYAHALRDLHVPLGVGTAFSTSLALAVSALYWIMAGLIYWRKGREWVGLVTSFTLITLACLDISLPSYAGFPWPIQIANDIANIAIFPVMIATLFTFPTGRFNPRWSLIPFAIIVVIAVLPNHAGSSLLDTLVQGAIFLSAPVIQIYRYRHLYDPVERQQTKVFVFGLGTAVALLLVVQLLGDTPSPTWQQIANGPVWLLIWLVLLLSISIPILRYRLWDIDILINRTLVYGSVTATLVATYAGLILLLQEIVRLITGGLSQQPLVIAVSTLAIAALIQPVRQYLQRTIDRRFYRRKYDAAKVVAAFSAALPHEVDLDDVRGHLIGVVHETVQPRFAGLWLRMADAGIEVLPIGSGPTSPANGE